MCDLRRDATTSLIELEYTTHTVEESLSNDKVPSGLPYASLDAHMQRLDVVFLSRFLFEILRYINLLLAMQPAPLEDADQDTDAADTSSPQSGKAGMVSSNADRVGFEMMFSLCDSMLLPTVLVACSIGGRALL